MTASGPFRRVDSFEIIFHYLFAKGYSTITLRYVDMGIENPTNSFFTESRIHQVVWDSSSNRSAKIRYGPSYNQWLEWFAIEWWRLEATVEVTSFKEGNLRPFRNSLFLMNQGIVCIS